jgi:Outer membrane protein beta-barrel domain
MNSKQLVAQASPCQTRLPTQRVVQLGRAGLVLLALTAAPGLVLGESSMSNETTGAVAGEKEITLSGTGSSDRNIDAGSFGMSGDLGWYITDQFVAGVRQSVSYASVEGDSNKDDFWNGATRGYVDYHFSDSAFRPFLGASLGGFYGDGISDSGFAGVEAGAKYYVLPKTFLLGRAEYQWFFRDTDDADNNFDDGAWAYTVGLGYNF